MKQDVSGRAQNLTGLTSQEVAERVAAGKTNANTDVKTKSVGQIFKEHAFTLFNFVNIVLAVLVFMTGQFRNATFMFVVVINLVIGVVQEVRAKRMVDKLSIIIEHKDVEISENRHVIRQASKCEYVDEPSDCPVLTLKAEYDRKKKLQLEKEAEEARLRAEEAQNEDGK
jgi:magnesium-transporting ATPase (P-type)